MTKTILVVDDDEDIVSIVTTLLQSEGYTTIGAYNGSDAFEKAKTQRPDLIIADIMMPVMDGWELCWRVRQNDNLADTPFIFLTARADVMDQIRGSEIGADDYIIKPFRKQEFLKRVASTFEVIDLLSKVKDGNGEAGPSTVATATAKVRKSAAKSTRKTGPKNTGLKKKKTTKKKTKKKTVTKKRAAKKKATKKKKTVTARKTKTKATKKKSTRKKSGKAPRKKR